MRKAWIAVVLVVLATAGCGSNGSDAGHAGHAGDTGDRGSGPMDMGTVPGEAADASEADRKVTVVASDDLRFDPESIEVSAGEVVTFVVRNDGETDHEFVLGDSDYQEMHESDMAQGDHDMGGMDNAVTVGPGESAEITWRFEEASEVLYGCHEPGHYEGGMVGTIDIG